MLGSSSRILLFSFSYFAFVAISHEREKYDSTAIEGDDYATQTTSYYWDVDEEPQQGCCERVRKVVSAGFDVSGKEMMIDVGHCRKICGLHSQHSHFGRPSLPNIFLASLYGGRQMEPSKHSCPDNGICRATRTRQERLSLFDGVKELPVIEDCHCQPRHQACQRVSHQHVLYPDSPSELTVDVGFCSGPCDGKNSSCQPTKNNTVIVDGPNGVKRCMQVVETCSCASRSCYRTEFYESYNELNINVDKGTVTQGVKEIDVGRCVCGEKGCEGLSQQHICVFRAPTNSSECLMSLKKKKVDCIPQTFTRHQFIDSMGKYKTVKSIDQCHCS